MTARSRCLAVDHRNYVALHYASRHMSWLHCMWGLGAAIGPYIMVLALAGAAPPGRPGGGAGSCCSTKWRSAPGRSSRKRRP